ncbi:orotidine-5'-phosphate decarboxylase [Brevibacterium sp. 50QC2O2]|jgi:orotidine-5'-phosphate decarboxylase|uniref:orotidine-5'-phosphate decarboxylase n=1 Tax=Brevibacterium TaxID=1696 RepID=UPI00211CBD50|nr:MULTISPECIES: orotidine-5'-phosphate decarboxylase [unclassified Brevibacterium]MCQ9366883.1 orotidine-5'-phosphate decarboxylase [Brevibacterium sp. 91QC2O2]MCQ9384033.1 orotidine-5'-phosphate decarboxylase [Brevibacterium sp. 68QC2CO]MCQ9389113.1 orotidine-5'-phosphate decarboxylase [Brevibacterium sp. 50QC2O2]
MTDIDFAAAWPAAVAASPLCVGIDPHPASLAAWGLPDTAAGAGAFADVLVDACIGRVGLLKPQSALFERFGSAGIAELERIQARIRAAGMLSVLDAKRGDIGSTMAGYADAYLRQGAPLACDALTVSPYLGMDSLEPAFAVARETGAGLFVLALTSNPRAEVFQHARTASGASVAAEVVARVHAENEKSGRAQFGLVVGATIGSAARRLDIDLGEFNGPILSPGVGAQGAGPAELDEVFGRSWKEGRVLVNVSRGVSQAGPEPARIVDRIAQVSASLA